MKEYKCSIIMSGYEGYTISSMMILNENDLEFLNRIAITLPFNNEDYSSIEFGVILLPDPIPDNTDTWFWNTPIKDINYIISSADPKIYEEFKMEWWYGTLK